ncbi:NPCBM/NEW2 domain-containing protein [Actinoplanes cyaneus]|uniref:NPCBM/NEW2 domain-containing protein n=1 Tax=Actinoplanes cyaneus TaxID=52696 RepID=UPI001944B889|nr:NPCBM/NEW2 domain-containing protein [Actinoplanes cyaneus]
MVSDAGGPMVLDKPLAGGDRAIALYNSTDKLATVGVAAGDTGLARAPAYRLHDVWSGKDLQAGTTIAAAVPPHGTVVYRVRPMAGPMAVPPSVTVGAGLATLVPGAEHAGVLTTMVTDRGGTGLTGVRVRVQAPQGWTVRPTSPPTAGKLAPDAALTTTWQVTVPDGSAAGRYPLTITASYGWGPHHRPAATSTGLDADVVTAPASGRWHLSALPTAAETDAEFDQSVGGAGIGDGNLITIAGHYYTRGLGVAAPDELLYYLGGTCSSLTTDVGVDDEDNAGTARFTVYADDTAVVSSGTMASGGAATTLTAGLSGIQRLPLAVDGTAGTHADWAAPVLTCGSAGPDDPVAPASRTLLSFEDGTDGFGIANPEQGGSVAGSSAFATDGTHGLQVEPPVNGNWFGVALTSPLDLTGTRALKYDVRAGQAGTSGEIAIQAGPDNTWCQGGKWAWTNAHASRSITESIDDISCPGGAPPDPTQVHGIWVFLNGGAAAEIDNIRAE